MLRSAHTSLHQERTKRELLVHRLRTTLNYFFHVGKSKLTCYNPATEEKTDFVFISSLMPLGTARAQPSCILNFFFFFFIFRSAAKPSSGSFVFGQNMSDRVTVRMEFLITCKNDHHLYI